MTKKKLIIDVREPFEFASGHVEGAINIPPSSLLSGALELDGVERDTEMVVYCLSGSRSNSSIQILKQMGFTNLSNGINAGHVKKNHL